MFHGQASPSFQPYYILSRKARPRNGLLGMSNLLIGGSVNHHRPAVPFREPQKEQLQR
jgi:hypothetical protein